MHNLPNNRERIVLLFVGVMIPATFAAPCIEAQENRAPVPNVFHSSLSGPAPHSVVFNAINSFDADGDDIDVTWHWGDGSAPETYPKEGPPGSTTGAVEHIFEDQGEYVVTATLTDERDATAEWSGVRVVVSSVPSDPRAIFTINPEQPGLGERFTVDGRLSFDRPSGPVARYFWEFGDDESATGSWATHGYYEPGDYLITLTVFDDEDPPNFNATARLVRIEDDRGPDRDRDGTSDSDDGCPDDPQKNSPGVCGCGQSDADRDGDGVADCADGCPDDPGKTMEGDCGCGAPDTDGDGVADCADACPDDPLKTTAGLCGCDVSESDSDGDAAPDCLDGCPLDPLKIAPQICGCGVQEADQDDDGTPDCVDECPLDPRKAEAGACGCDSSDVDSDQDGVLDCQDGCPLNPLKTSPGLCGCDFSDADSDGDGVVDCRDFCAGTDLGRQVDNQGCVPSRDADEPAQPSPTRTSSGPCGSLGFVGFLTPLVLLGLQPRGRQRRLLMCRSLAVGLIFLAACVSDQAHRYYATERYPQRAIEEVELLFSTPARPYDVIADFQARGASPKYMRKKAAEIGADAIIVGMYGGYRAISDEWAGEDQQAASYSRITGTAIRYRR